MIDRIALSSTGLRADQFVMQSRSYPSHFETTVSVAARAQAVFEYLDDHQRLSSHMMDSSAMMAGGKMHFSFDAGRGQTVGSVIQMSGRILGMTLAVEEAITERVPPWRKAWETCGTPRLMVVGHYRMGFEITDAAEGCRLRFFIDYGRPEWPWRPLGFVAGSWYARWCVRSMAEGAARKFSGRLGA
ncbi:SRPBCC family protein [Sphingobium sp.]|uniref:SRPBCC family protein n=1 Tax=Sphingobium sp. TaxID=1912891 RepID=UPI002E1D0B2F